MRICVTGPNGNIGSVLVKRGAIPLDCDITDYEDVRKVVEKANPDIIVHTASKSSPDWCEDKKNTSEANNVNTMGLSLLEDVVGYSTPIVALSTDHVFPGKSFFDREFGWLKAGPYVEKDKKFPVNHYGLTKIGMEILGEMWDNVKIVRTSNCFWDKDPRVEWYIDQLYKQEKVPVPVFQKRSFMHIEHFAESIEAYCERFTEMPKILHISGTETIDWYTFVKEFANEKSIPVYMQKKFTKKWFDDNRKAKRPKKAGLNVELSAKLGLPQFSYLDGMELL